MNAYKITYKTYSFGTIYRVALIVAEDRGEAIEILKEQPTYSNDPDAEITRVEELDMTKPGCLLIKPLLNC